MERLFLLTPLREGRPRPALSPSRTENISTHAPAGGATTGAAECAAGGLLFLLTPLREGRPHRHDEFRRAAAYFYSRPCGRGDSEPNYHIGDILTFLLTPLREGRRTIGPQRAILNCYFYSRPCGRGDQKTERCAALWRRISTHAPAGGATSSPFFSAALYCISTHAPAGGATAIFHKSVMRFCGKLPKDDTVLCLASFGFPRRDPKAVYLAWISCANLPQKCVREGLALKDQGTSCFHEGLASHAFDPVLV